MNKKLNDTQMIMLKQLLNCLSDNQKDEIQNEFFNDDLSIITDSKSNYKFDKNDIVVIECPHCHSKHIVKHGKYNDIQRYKCKDCNSFFMRTKNTVLFKTRKNIKIWIKYLKCMLDKKPLREIQVICGISLRTAHKWRHKILDILSKMSDDTKLNGIIESDETFTAVSYKGNHKNSKNFVMPRKAHKSGNEIHTRGLSSEQVCIFTAVSLNNLSYGKVSNLGKPTWKKLFNVLNEHIEKGSILVTDDFSGYDKISNELDLEHISIKSGTHRNGTFNIQSVNSYHSEFKRLINSYFKGVATKYLNNYIAYHTLLFKSDYDKSNKIIDLQDNVFKTKYYDTFKGSDRPAIPA